MIQFVLVIAVCALLTRCFICQKNEKKICTDLSARLLKEPYFRNNIDCDDNWDFSTGYKIRGSVL
jgi:hypothetical protein